MNLLFSLHACTADDAVHAIRIQTVVCLFAAFSVYKKSLFRFFGLTSISFRFGLEFFYLSWPIVIIIIIIIWSVLCTIIRFSDAIEYLFYNFFFASLHHLKLRLLLLFLIFFVWTILFFYITFGCCCFEFAHRMNKRTISTSKQK